MQNCKFATVKKDTGLYGSWDKIEQTLVYWYGVWLKVDGILFTLLNYYIKIIYEKGKICQIVSFQ